MIKREAEMGSLLLCPVCKCNLWSHKTGGVISQETTQAEGRKKPGLSVDQQCGGGRGGTRKARRSRWSE